MTQQIQVQNLDHLGLVAGIIDDLQIERSRRFYDTSRFARKNFCKV